MFPFVTETGPVLALGGTVATIEVLLQLVAVAAAPLKFTVLLPIVVPNPEPDIVTEEPGAPVAGDMPVITGLASDPPEVTETLSNVAVDKDAVLPLFTPKPTYTVSAVVKVCVVPICVQVVPFVDT